MHIHGIGTSLRQISFYDMGMKVDEHAQDSQCFVYVKKLTIIFKVQVMISSLFLSP
jgi:hypothetical protein